MKIFLSKKVYGQLSMDDQSVLKETPCGCLIDGAASIDCDSCDGDGVVYEMALSSQDEAAIEDNLRRQGVPLGKSGSN